MAIQINATDIHLRSSQSMGLLATNPFSVTTWINTVWNPGTCNSYVGIYGPATDTPLDTPVTAVQIGTVNGTGDVTCWTWGGGTLVGSATGVMTAYNNLWVNITYTFDGTNHVLYRNGVQLATATTAQQAGYLNQVYINGYPGGGAAEVASAQVDQYCLYGRTLSAGEVQTIYYAAGNRHGIVRSVIAAYEFDEAGQGVTTTSCVDNSGSGNTLTSTGAGTAITYTYPGTVANSNIRPVQ